MGAALLKALYFASLFALFALMQWYVSYAYKRWVRRSCKEEFKERWHLGGVIFLWVGNVTFALRFLITELGVYENWVSQYLIIYPGAMFFAAISLTTAVLILYDIPRQSAKLVSAYISWRKEKKNNEEAIIPVKNEQVFNPSRRRFLKYAGAAVATVPFVISIRSTRSTARDYQIVNKELFFEDLPEGLDGLRLVQLSDIHSGMFMTQRQIAEIFDITNSLKPDIVAITGDFVDSSPSEIPAVRNEINRLQTNYGVFGCLGNHDHYASATSVTSALRSQGLMMLNNEAQVLDIHGTRLNMLGIDDAGRPPRDYARLDWALQQADSSAFNILLSHRPEQFINASKSGVQLTLSGHTHGGQIGGDVFGLRLYPIEMVHPYSQGLYHRGDHKMYVNVGVGMVGVPIRLVRPEITELTLRKKSLLS